MGGVLSQAATGQIESLQKAENSHMYTNNCLLWPEKLAKHRSKGRDATGQVGYGQRANSLKQMSNRVKHSEQKSHTLQTMPRPAQFEVSPMVVKPARQANSTLICAYLS